MSSGISAPPETPGATMEGVAKKKAGKPGTARPRYEITDHVRKLLQTAIAVDDELQQRRIAKAVGISEASLSNILNGDSATSEHLLRICEEAGVPTFEALPLSPLQKRWLSILYRYEKTLSAARVEELVEDEEHTAEGEEAIVKLNAKVTAPPRGH